MFLARRESSGCQLAPPSIQVQQSPTHASPQPSPAGPSASSLTWPQAPSRAPCSSSSPTPPTSRAGSGGCWIWPAWAAGSGLLSCVAGVPCVPTCVGQRLQGLRATGLCFCNTSPPAAACLPLSRLTDVRANAKFSSPYATAEDIASVRECCPTVPTVPDASASCARLAWPLLPPTQALPCTAGAQQLSPLPAAQGRREDLRSVVEHLRKRFNVEYIYCWHGAVKNSVQIKVWGRCTAPAGSRHGSGACAQAVLCTALLVAAHPAAAPAHIATLYRGCLRPDRCRAVGLLERCVSQCSRRAQVRLQAVLPQAHARAERDRAQVRGGERQITGATYNVIKRF